MPGAFDTARWRGLALPFFLLPLVPASFINLVTGQQRPLLGCALGFGLTILAILRLRRGRRGDSRIAALLVGAAAGLTAGLGAAAGPVGAVLLGAAAWWGARLFYEGVPEVAPPSPPVAPVADAWSPTRDRLAALRAGAIGPGRPLLGAVEALADLVEALVARADPPHDARRLVNLQLDGLERIGRRLAAGAVPPPSLATLLDDLAAGSRAHLARLREADSAALDVQVKVLAERLQQEGYA